MKPFARPLISLSLFLLSSYLLFAAEEPDLFWIPFGEGQEALGADLEAGEEWFPVFFALDAAGSVHVPDFFKGRVAVYDRDGTFRKGLPAPELVSPRMNVFGLAADGSYFSFTDFAFVSADSAGKTRWSVRYPIGTMLAGAVATDDAVYLIIGWPGEQSSLRVPNGEAEPAVGKLSRALPKGSGAPVRNAKGDELCFRLIDEVASGKPIVGLAADEATGNYDLACLGSDGTSVWIGQYSREYRLLVLSEDRRVIDRFSIEKRWLSGTRGFRIYSVAAPELAAISGGAPNLGLGIVTVSRK